jgi:hypothetical protein
MLLKITVILVHIYLNQEQKKIIQLRFYPYMCSDRDFVDILDVSNRRVVCYVSNVTFADIRCFGHHPREL